jgi:uncharacterized protein (DUF1501 family)
MEVSPAMHMQRRDLLKAASILPATGMALSSLAFAATPAQRVLVVVFLRGGADALNIVAPADDRHYMAARPPELRLLAQGDRAGLRWPQPFSEADWRMHPACAPLLDVLQSGHAQALHACGLQNATRSHFEAQEMLESSSSKALSLAPGWLAGRVRNDAGLGAIATSAGQVRALAGDAMALNLSGELRNAVNLPWDDQGRQVLEALYASAPTSPQGPAQPQALIQVGQTTLNLMGRIQAKLPRSEGRTLAYTPPAGVRYNNENGDWLQACQTVAQLVRMDLGLQVACLDLGGWDTHEYQAGRINNLLRQWSTNLRALFDDLSASGHAATLVVMSEFGRRLKANASNGTDHGHGGLLWALDTGARKLLPPTLWPGLSTPELDQGLDLKSSTDTKAVLASIAQKSLG